MPKLAKSHRNRRVSLLLVALSGLVVGFRNLPPNPVRLASDEDGKVTRVAVIPFQNLGDSKEPSLIGEDIAESVTKSLFEISGLAVLGQDVVSQQSFGVGPGALQAKLAETLETAKRLHIDTLVAGDYKRSGKSIQIHCSIIDVATGQPVAGKGFKRDAEYPDKYLSLLGELPGLVEKSLLPSSASTSRLKPVGPKELSGNIEAHQLYSAGVAKAKLNTQQGYADAVELYRQALAKDPDFAQALTAKAAAETELSALKSDDGEDAVPDRKQAFADALAAVKKSPYSGEAHWEMSRVLNSMGDYEDAAMAARVAAQIWPANARVYVDLGRAIGKGQVMDGAEVRHAIQMTPAVGLVVPDFPKVTIVNSGAAPIEVKFTSPKGEVAASEQVPAGASRIVAILEGPYSVMTTVGGQTKVETRQFTSDTVYAVDGRTLAVTSPPNGGRRRVFGAGSDSGNTNIKRNAKTHEQMVYVPPGPCKIGDDSQPDNKEHDADLTAYWMGQTLVSVRDFRAFTNSPEGYELAFARSFDWNGRKPAFGWNLDFPMVNVDWEEARAYCIWAGGDLPTETQWEHAARGNGHNSYPWTGGWNPESLQSAASGPAAVDAHKSGASPYGCYDMAGNVAQWCRDGYQPDLSRLPKDPVGQGASFVIRGMAWDQSDPVLFLSTKRTHLDPVTLKPIDMHYRAPTLGFRVVYRD